jgi:hypothetical protein
LTSVTASWLVARSEATTTEHQDSRPTRSRCRVRDEASVKKTCDRRERARYKGSGIAFADAYAAHRKFDGGRAL